MTESKAAATLRIQRALEKIERAQQLLGEAAGELCPIVGVVQEYDRAGKLYDQVHAFWYRVNGKLTAGKFDLDSDAKVGLLTRRLERELGRKLSSEELKSAWTAARAAEGVPA